jgi:DNA repair protein RadC
MSGAAGAGAGTGVYGETVQLISFRVIREEASEVSGFGAVSPRRIAGPADVEALLGAYMRGLPQEELWAIPVDVKSNVLGLHLLYRGSLNSSVVRPAEVFRVGILTNAASLLIVHNHPSGDPTPSGADVATTRALIEAGKLLELPLIDHVIIGADRWVSMRESGACLF